MGVIFDSCVWIGVASGAISAESVLAACGDAPVYASVISLGELRFSVESMADPAQRAVRAACLQVVEPVLPCRSLGIPQPPSAAWRPP